MGWADETSAETLTESAAGAGAYMSAGVSLFPRETIEFRFKRTDTPTEAWGFEIYASLDDVTYGSRPVAVGRLPATSAEGVLIVTGPKFVKARIINVDPTPVDVVVVDVSYRLDGVNIS